MYIKRNLIRAIRNLCFQIKGIGVFIFIPILGLYVFMPVKLQVEYIAYERLSMVYDLILKDTQFFIPLLSVWYTIFILHYCLEEPGHDLLYIRKRSKLLNVLIIYMIYLIMLLPLFAIYSRFFPEMWWLYIKIAIICLFYQSIVYFFSFLCGKIEPAIIVILLYTIYVIATEGYLDTSHLNFNLSYFGEEVLKGIYLLCDIKYFMIAIAVLLVGGSICNYYYPERNQ